MMTPTFSLHRGNTPLLISMPHCGEALPEALQPRLTPLALTLGDTDWHLPRLYDFAGDLGASMLQPHYSRYLIDLNRPADNTPLYPGAAGTDLCPLTTFDGEPLYREGEQPTDAEVAQRLRDVWQPYHAALGEELARLREQFGFAVLFEAHSIRSVVPRLFDGELPVFSLGTAGGSSCAASLRQAASNALAEDGRSLVVDARFKGGYITRAYGDPANNIHSMQLELAQRSYMQESEPYHYLPDVAAGVKPSLQNLIQSLLDWAGSQPS